MNVVNIAINQNPSGALGLVAILSIFVLSAVLYIAVMRPIVKRIKKSIGENQDNIQQ